MGNSVLFLTYWTMEFNHMMEISSIPMWIRLPYLHDGNGQTKRKFGRQNVVQKFLVVGATK